MESIEELPILVTGFNRPELLNNTLSLLREFGQLNVWIVIDGPRSIDVREDELTYRCREIAKQFESIAEGRILIRDTNLGCKYGMYEAINWFFSNNTKGLVIEDDLVFRRDFLKFGYESLNSFETDETVGSITGYMPIDIDSGLLQDSLRFVRHPFFSAWGWGSWSNRWQKYDLEMKSWRSELSFLRLASRVKWHSPRYWARRFDQMSKGEVDTWDFQFLFCHIKNNWDVVAPKRNLIQNVGFGEFATHTKRFREIPKLHGFDFGVTSTPRVQELNRVELLRYLNKQFGL